MCGEDEDAQSGCLKAVDEDTAPDYFARSMAKKGTTLGKRGDLMMRLLRLLCLLLYHIREGACVQNILSIDADNN